MHHKYVSTNYDWLPHNQDTSISTPSKYKNMPINPLGDRQTFYNNYINGCKTAAGMFKAHVCTYNDEDRIEMLLRQPQSMQNYTDIGFKKIKAPKSLYTALTTFWEKNKDNGKLENWGSGNVYTNSWEVPSEMVSVDDTTLRGAGAALKKKLWDDAKKVGLGQLSSFVFTILNFLI